MVSSVSNDGLVTNQEGVLDQALRIVRRRKLVVLQALIVVPLLALLFSLAQDKEYTASATLLFRAPELPSESNTVIDPVRTAATNTELVALPVVAERTAEDMRASVSPGEVFSSISVEASTDADTAELSATTDSPELSAEMANTYGAAYIEFRRKADRAQVQEAIDLAEASLERLTPAEQESGEGDALNEQLDQLKLTQALQTGGAELVQRATPPSSPSSPKPVRNVILGIVLGGLLGFGLAALLERIDRRVRTVEELEDLYGLPILARIPRSSLLEKSQPKSVSPQTPEGEAFRVLRTNLRYFNVDRDLRSVLLISPEAGDGKSTVARGLAMTMAEMGDDVVLVEADLRKGGSLRAVTGKPADGLSNVLAGTELDKVLVKVGVLPASHAQARELTILPSGPVPPNPSELLESDRMRSLLLELRERFDIVILDSPALGAVSDSLALISEVSGIVVVGGLGATTRDAARALSKQLSLLGQQPIGTVANFTEPQHDKYAHYYHSELAGNSASST
jgi:tyrosine-protein kinase